MERVRDLDHRRPVDGHYIAGMQSDQGRHSRVPRSNLAQCDRETWRMAFRYYYCAFLMCATIPTSALADFDQGLSAYKSGDYRTASSEFRLLAKAGQADAQFYLARMYYEGRGAPKIYSKAAIWFRRAAEQRHAGAMNFMGILYHLGHGVSKDLAEAIRWYRMAAESGSDEAKFNLGGMYEVGAGTAQDDVQAYMWHLLATLGDLSDEQRKQVLQALAKVEKRLTPNQIAEAKRLTQAWLRMVGDNKH